MKIDKGIFKRVDDWANEPDDEGKAVARIMIMLTVYVVVVMGGIFAIAGLVIMAFDHPLIIGTPLAIIAGVWAIRFVRWVLS